MNHLLQSACCAFLLLIPLPKLSAQQSADSSNLKLSLAVDAYYAYSFNQPAEGYRPYTTQAVRQNEFNINWAYIQADYENEIIRATLALHSGTYPIYNYFEDGLLRTLSQVHAGVRLTPNVWLDIGLMNSHIGYESTYSGDNELYTRALMADGSPYFSTGVQLSGDFSKKLSFKAVVINGWQNILETNKAKSFGINLNYHPNGKAELNYSNYFGNESTNATPDYRFFQHSYFKYQFSELFHLVLSLDAGIQGLNPNRDTHLWWTGMILGQYKPAPKWAIGGRLEFFHDPYTLIYSPPPANEFSVKSASIDVSYRPLPQAIIRLQGQWYGANDPIFPTSDGSFRNNDFVIATSLAIKIP